MSSSPSLPDLEMRTFESLSEWAADTTGKTVLKATKEGHSYTLVDKSSRTLKQRFTSLFSSSSPPADQYKDLKSALIHLHKIVAKTHEGLARRRLEERLQAIYARVAKEFESARTGPFD